MARLKVNFSQDEAESKVREIPPSGTYLCSVVDVEMKEVKPGSPNSGKPFWNIRFVVQEGKYEGSSIFSNVMLFSTEKSGTLSQLSMFLKALGFTVTPGEMELPDDEEVQGKNLMVTGRKVPAGTDKNGKDFNEQFRVTGFKPADTATVNAVKNSSILP